MRNALVSGIAVVASALTVLPVAAGFPEVGTNDFRISWMGPPGVTSWSGIRPDVAYNSRQHEYLVVWSGYDADLNDWGVYARRVDAATGALLGSTHIVVWSDAGWTQPGPAVAYNSLDNEYVVAYETRYGSGRKIAATFVDGVTGQMIFTWLIADIQNPSATPGAQPAVVFNDLDDIYLVAWSGSTYAYPDEGEIYTCLFDHSSVGAPHKISYTGPDGDPLYLATEPSVAFNGLNQGEYLVVWSGSDAQPYEYEIYGQLLDSTGVEIGVDDFRISSMGPDGSNDSLASSPSVAFSEWTSEYLVVWSGNDPPRTGIYEYEIFGQRLDESGNEVGEDDFRVSHMGPDGEWYVARKPHLELDVASGEYLVVWYGDDDCDGMVVDEHEIFGQYLSLGGASVGPGHFRLSDMGPDGDDSYDASWPSVASNGSGGQYLAVWMADDNAGGMVDEELEIFGQRLFAGGLFGDPFESGDTGLWSAVVPAR